MRWSCAPLAALCLAIAAALAQAQESASIPAAVMIGRES